MERQNSGLMNGIGNTDKCKIQSEEMEETDMTETEILQEIRNGGYENSILVWLLNDRIRHINSLEGKNAGLNATITAIRTINKEKNEAIAALLEL